MCTPMTSWQFLSVSAVNTGGPFDSRDRNSPSELIRGGLSCLNKLPEAAWASRDRSRLRTVSSAAQRSFRKAYLQEVGELIVDVLLEF